MNINDPHRIELLKNYVAEFNATSGAEAQKLGFDLKAHFIDFGISDQSVACSITLDKAFVTAITTHDLFFEKPGTSDSECIRQDLVTKHLTQFLHIDKDVLDKLKPHL